MPCNSGIFWVVGSAGSNCAHIARIEVMSYEGYTEDHLYFWNGTKHEPSLLALILQFVVDSVIVYFDNIPYKSFLSILKSVS